MHKLVASLPLLTMTSVAVWCSQKHAFGQYAPQPSSTQPSGSAYAWAKSIAPADSTAGVENVGLPSFAAAPDGGLLIAAEQSIPDGLPRRLWLLRLDQNGSVLWQKSFLTLGGFGLADTVIRPSVALRGDGGWYVAASLQTVGASFPQGVLLLSLDSSGTLQWAKAIAPGDLSATYFFDPGLVATPDGGAVVVSSALVSPGLAKTLVTRVNGAGSLLWSHSLSSKIGTGYLAPWDVNVSLDGGVFLVLRSIESEHHGVVVRLDPLGAILWSQMLGSAGETTTALVGGRESAGGTHVGGLIHPSDQGWYPFVISLDQVGNILWRRVWTYDWMTIKGLSPTASGGVLVSGDHHLGTSSDFLAMELDRDGIPAWSRVFGGASDEGSIYLDVRCHSSFDGGALLVGPTESFVPRSTIQAIWSVRLDPAGKIAFTPQSGASLSDVQIPTTQSVSIDAVPIGISVSTAHSLAIPVAMTEMATTAIVQSQAP